MKILILHNAYQKKGGEDRVVETEYDLLRGRGVGVAKHIVHNDAIATLADRVRIFSRVKNNPGMAAQIHEVVDRECPDLVHIHNFFPQLTPSIHKTLAARGLPIVQTLHNYRLLCANAMFMRDERVCELCLGGGNHHALFHRCYRGSLPATLAVLRMQNAAIGDEGWQRSVSQFIALTQFSRSKFIEGGLPGEKIAVKPNFVPDPGLVEPGEHERSGALFVGRIAPGKGVSALVEASRFMPALSVTIVGDGPDLALLRQRAPANVSFTGQLPGEQVLAKMKRAAMLIMPSSWYEGFPVTLVEAFSCGLPVIAPRLGSLGEIIENGRNGLLYEPDDPAGLRDMIKAAFADAAARHRMSQGARTAYEQCFSPDTNFAQLMDIYHTALDGSSAPG